jgi:hypothetical protein
LRIIAISIHANGKAQQISAMLAAGAAVRTELHENREWLRLGGGLVWQDKVLFSRWFTDTSLGVSLMAQS